MPISLHSQSETQHWISSLNLHHSLQQKLPDSVSNSKGMRFLRIYFPVEVLAQMTYTVRNLSRNLGVIA